MPLSSERYQLRCNSLSVFYVLSDDYIMTFHELHHFIAKVKAFRRVFVYFFIKVGCTAQLCKVSLL